MKKKGEKGGKAGKGENKTRQQLVQALLAQQEVQSRLSMTQKQNVELKQVAEEELQKNVSNILNHNATMSHIQNELAEANSELVNRKYQYDQQLRKNEKQEKKFEEDKALSNQEWEEKLYHLESKHEQLKEDYAKIEHFNKEKTELKAKINDLEKTIKECDKKFMKELSAKDRDKVQTTDKIKKDMLHKIQKTKASLMRLKTDQLETTTRLTVLQNHQLTTELEYQSKQTEKLLFKNAQLTEEVSGLKRDIEIHKQVESELAKRSHFCQKLIKKLTGKVSDLEEQLELERSNKSGKKQKAKKQSDEKPDQNKNDLITFLEKSLQQSEKKIAKVKNDYDILKNEYDYLSQKHQERYTEYKNVAQLITDNLQQLKIKSGKVFEMAKENYPQLNIKLIKSQPIENLEDQQKYNLLNLLLSQVKDKLNKTNMRETVDPDLYMNTMGNSQLSLPKIKKQKRLFKMGNMSMNSGRFTYFPVSVSSKVVRSNVRKWGGRGHSTKPKRWLKNKRKY